MKFGKSPVDSFLEVFLKKKLTNAHTHAPTHAHTRLSLYKYIINRIIKEFASINLIY